MSNKQKIKKPVSRRPQITVGVPFYLDRYEAHIDALDVLRRSEKYEIGVLKMQGTFLHQSRNSIWNSVQGDYLLSLDSDIVISGEDLDKLIALDRDIAAGWYINRYNGKPVVFRKVREDDPEPKKRWEVIDPMPEVPFTCDATGMGCMLIKRSLIEEWNALGIQEGPFDFLPSPLSEYGAQTDGEDVSFCRRMADFGKEIWIHPEVNVGHCAQLVIRKGGVSLR